MQEYAGLAPERGRSAELRRELLAAGFVIERWGEDARLILSADTGPCAASKPDRRIFRKAQELI